MSGQRMKILALLLACAALVSLPFWVGNAYYINIASQVLIYAVLSMGLNILVGYAGLVTLGHAGLFGVSCYAAATLINAGHGSIVATIGALAATLVATAIFAMLSLRATGLGFVMITVALGQIVWGIAFRWISLTNGDNGVSINTRPHPFGIALDNAPAFYWATLVVFLIALGCITVFVASPFGAAVRGTRDQPRRMTALGYNVWLTRFLAFLLSGFWSGVAGLLYLYYNQFVSPETVALSSSAEALLMVIAGGTATIFGPIFGAALVVIIKDVASAYISRWNFMLGAIFVLIVVFMPEGFVPGSVRLWRWAIASRHPRARVLTEERVP
ncbi:MAG TPA: branched-chain amino acid ABC transporter permease [Acetobacteraceae bacterium]|nr:branched-chain amino acid ABC transporter permease [Acetobacteraceae bacterium]